MNPDDQRLLRHLTKAVTLKLLVLALLWWAFVRDTRVAVQPEQAAAHLLQPAAPAQPAARAAPTSAPGAQP